MKKSLLILPLLATCLLGACDSTTTTANITLSSDDTVYRYGDHTINFSFQYDGVILSNELKTEYFSTANFGGKTVKLVERVNNNTVKVTYTGEASDFSQSNIVFDVDKAAFTTTKSGIKVDGKGNVKTARNALSFKKANSDDATINDEFNMNGASLSTEGLTFTTKNDAITAGFIFDNVADDISSFTIGKDTNNKVLKFEMHGKKNTSPENDSIIIVDKTKPLKVTIPGKFFNETGGRGITIAYNYDDITGVGSYNVVDQLMYF